MTFKSAYLKLTLYYVLIIMAVSVVFSILIFQLSSREINRGLNPGSRIFRDFPPRMMNDDLENLLSEQYNASRAALRDNLIYLNLIILILSASGSYFFARRTLRPIAEMVEGQNRFTADASHELKTPLAVMRSEIEVNMRDKNLSLDSAKKLLGSNLEEIAKLESLSNALLKLARYQEDIKLSFVTLSLEAIIIEAYEKIDSLAIKKNIELICHPELDSGSGSIKILGDYQSLIELFIILLDNAVKYSHENSKIYINVEQDKEHVIVKIKDHGIGIKASDLPYIFNRFYRADSSRAKDKIGGYGLGLSIAKRIAELHSGKITATSTPGKGSEFSVIL